MNRANLDWGDSRSKPASSSALSSGSTGRTTTGVPSRRRDSNRSSRRTSIDGGFRSEPDRRGVEAGTPAMLARLEQAGLLRLEFLLGEDALLPEPGQLGDLVRDGDPGAAGRWRNRGERR